MEFLKMSELTPTNGLPDVLGGVDTPEKWAERREYIKELVSHYMLGHRPANDAKARGEVISSKEIYDGKGIRDEVKIWINDVESFPAYIQRPNREGKFPCVTWIYFTGHDVSPIEDELLDRGWVLAAFDYNDLCKDDGNNPESPAKRAYPEADWAAIQIWGWGFSKVADYLETLPYVDMRKLMCTGHSRNGKAALAAGAFDERFTVVAPNNSGCGGCGCYRYLGDTQKITQDPVTVESLGRIVHNFPHWFSKNLDEFGGQEEPYYVANEDKLPFDLHFMKVLIAPRGLITVEGTEDLWANCYGSYLTRLAAQPAFELLGAPENNQQIIRNGPHGHTARGWQWSTRFAEQVWARMYE